MLTYRIEPTGNQFVVIDSLDQLVGKYDTEAKAKQSISECMKEDAMYETAKLLVESAIKAHMEQFNVSREVASYWIGCGAEVVGVKRVSWFPRISSPVVTMSVRSAASVRMLPYECLCIVGPDPVL